MQKTDTNYKRFFWCKFLSFRGRSPWNLKNLHPLNDERAFAFTLAEVLITLTIIGVIAALTIPNLMQSYKKHQVEVGVKEAYSILNNALIMARTENISFDDMIQNSYQTPENVAKASDYFSENYLKPYLKYSDYCPISMSINKCKAFNNLSSIAPLDGKSSSFFPSQWSRFMLTNGMAIGVSYHLPYSASRNSNAINFIVDINGNRGPNKNGYDVFYFGIFRSDTGLYCNENGPAHDLYCNKGNILVPGAKEYQQTSINAVCNGHGSDCCSVIMRNGWKIPDDYPIKKF